MKDYRIRHFLHRLLRWQHCRTSNISCKRGTPICVGRDYNHRWFRGLYGGYDYAVCISEMAEQTKRKREAEGWICRARGNGILGSYR